MILLSILLATLAQDDGKKAQELLDAVGAKLKDAPAIQIEYVWHVQTPKKTAKIKFSLMAKRPNLLWFTEKEKDSNSEMTLFDGKWFWRYDTDENEYTKSTQSPYIFNTYISGNPLQEIFFKGASRMLHRASEIKVGEEKLENETCRTISWTRKRGKARTETSKLWIDSRDLIRRSEGTLVSGEDQSEETLDYKKVDLNPKLPDDAFTFKPKEGAKGAKETGSSDELLPIGSQAPDFEAADLDGKKVKLTDYKGETVLLNFWFHDCGSCREEFPHIEELVGDLKDRKFVVLAISTHDPVEKIRKFFQAEKYTFLPLVQKDEAISKAYKVEGCPTNYLISPDGKILERVTGALVEDNLREFVENSLQRK